jgi:hypothetical protein
LDVRTAGAPELGVLDLGVLDLGAFDLGAFDLGAFDLSPRRRAADFEEISRDFAAVSVREFAMAQYD